VILGRNGVLLFYHGLTGPKTTVLENNDKLLNMKSTVP